MKREFAYIHDEENVPETFHKIPFLESFSKEHLDQVLYASNFVECEDGEVIIQEGEEASRIFILIGGAVAVVKGGDEIVLMNTVGDIFGELAAFEDEVRSASVLAKGQALCLAVDQKFLEHLLPKERNAEFYASLYEFIAKLTTKRLRATSDYLAGVDEQRRALLERVAELEAAKQAG